MAGLDHKGRDEAGSGLQGGWTAAGGRREGGGSDREGLLAGWPCGEDEEDPLDERRRRRGGAGGVGGAAGGSGEARAGGGGRGRGQAALAEGGGGGGQFDSDSEEEGAADGYDPRTDPAIKAVYDLPFGLQVRTAVNRRRAGGNRSANLSFALVLRLAAWRTCRGNPSRTHV